LKDRAEASVIKMPFEIYDEIEPHSGPLSDWLRLADVRAALVLSETVNSSTVQRVLSLGYAADLTDVEIEEIGRDPFLIAAALNGADRVVVTREVSRPSAQRSNRKIPDICKSFGLPCITDFELYRQLSFSIR
jgi:hypothetical protein